MKFYILIIILIIAGNLSAKDELASKLYLKLKKGTPEYLLASANQPITEFSSILGEYSIAPLFNHTTIEFVHRRIKEKKKILPQGNIKMEVDISALFEIKYSADILPKVAAEKLSKLSFLQYIEPIHDRFICSTPNDTLATFQYYLPLIKADSAWDYILNDTTLNKKKEIIVGIVDTGVDYNHPDLNSNIYYNQGEIGTDENGLDKKSNKFDDDGNGFIDDWQGWDFIGGWDSENQKQTGEDNDPINGPSHGTHCAGICSAISNNLIGIAGIALNTKILVVKNADDNPFARSVSKGYQGILFAAISGADIISCSWGGSGYSLTEQEIINQVLELGSLVIAAAGNDGKNTTFYPASYEGVISVASTDEEDVVSDFSNFDYSVDVSAPGSNIISTTPGNSYEFMSGTSMATPVVAGVATLAHLAHPELTNIEIGELIKATSDRIYNINSSKIGLIGSGRVNALKMVQKSNTPMLSPYNYILTNRNGSDYFMPRDTIDLIFDLKIYLNNISNLSLIATNESETESHIEFISPLIKIGDLKKDGIYKKIGPISFIIRNSVPYNYKQNITIRFYGDDNFSFITGTKFSTNPTYLTMNNDVIKTTVNSRGNIAYNDYPGNEQGEGFTFMSSANMLYEGSIMVCRGKTNLSDVARDASGSNQSNKFFISERISKTDKPDYQVSTTKFNDPDLLMSPNPKNNANVDIENSYYIFKNKDLDNVLFVISNIINKGPNTDSLYLGYYFDWDLGNESSDDLCVYDYKHKYGYVINTNEKDQPIVGVKLLSDKIQNFFALDNGGKTDDNFGVYDGFSDVEKIKSLTSGILRDTSSITDVSMITGAGPINVLSNDTLRISFAIISGNTTSELEKSINTIEQLGSSIFDFNGKYLSPPLNISIESLYPNPILGWNLKIKYLINQKTNVAFKIYDIRGLLVYDMQIGIKDQGRYVQELIINDLPPGKYFLSLDTNNGKTCKDFIILK